MKLNLNMRNTRIACLLLLSLAMACDSGSGGGNSAQDGGDQDGGSSTQGGNAGDGDAASSGNDAGDGGDASAGTGGSTTVPTVLSTVPLDAASGVAVNGNISATFSEAMDPKTLTTSTFTLTTGAAATPVKGSVIYADSKVTFWPEAHLASGASFTATLTIGAKSGSGIALAEAHVWSFMTGSMVAAGLPVRLGTAANYVILSKTGISTVPKSAITGDIAVSPIKAAAITGFSLTADATTMFATSTQVTGKVYASDYKAPTPAKLTTAVSDMQLAFTDAASRAPGKTELGAGSIGGMTLAPGVYKWGTGVLIATNVTLEGSATDVWIFQIGKGLKLSSGAKILLKGALAKNIFWQAAGAVELGTTSHLEGIVLTQTAITLGTGASVKGRLLAQTAVSLDKNVVAQPAP